MNDSKNVVAAVFPFAKISKCTEIFNPMVPSRYWSAVEISRKVNAMPNILTKQSLWRLDILILLLFNYNSDFIELPEI